MTTQEKMTEAVLRLAEKTGRQFMVQIELRATFSVARQRVETGYVGYIENAGHCGLGRNETSLEAIECGLAALVDVEEINARAVELEEKARQLRALAGGVK